MDVNLLHMKILMLLLFCLLSCMTEAQIKNTATEVKDYREVDGKIILEMAVNGEVASLCWIWLDIRPFYRNIWRN